MFGNRSQARSSVVEHYLDTVGVGGSKPLAPTTYSENTGWLRLYLSWPFLLCPPLVQSLHDTGACRLHFPLLVQPRTNQVHLLVTTSPWTTRDVPSDGPR